MDNHGEIIWNKKSAIGNQEIDDEHSKLFDIYQELIEFVQTNGTRSEFAQILSKMTDYSLIHFKKEEAYMKKMGFSKFREHKNYHMNYIYKVAMFNVELLSENPPDPNEIITFLEKWWGNHILKIDTEYENFRKESQADIIYGY